MKFKIGHTKRPKNVADNGIVVYEHYTRKGGEGPDSYELTETTPTQEECEAYGFTWLRAEGNQPDRCACIDPDIEQTSLASKEQKLNNNLDIGNDNFFNRRTYTSAAVGMRNEMGRETNNNLLTGDTNTVDDSVRNSVVSGTKGNATIQNHYVHGGNQITDNLGERQYTRVIFGMYTTVAGTQPAYINNDGASWYPIPENTAMMFNASCLAVRVGGSSGTGSVGDFYSWLERGVVINRAGTLQIKRTRKNMSNDGTGTSNWRPTAAIDGTNFKITFRGAADMNIEFVATVDFTELRTGVDIS